MPTVTIAPLSLSAGAFPEATPLNVFLAWNEGRYAKDRRYRIIRDIHRMLHNFGSEICLAHLAGQRIALRRSGGRIVVAPAAQALARRCLTESIGTPRMVAAQQVIELATGRHRRD